MSDLKNIEGAVGDATRFVHATWQQAYMGTIPSIPPVKTNVNNRREAADSLVIGTQLNIPDAGRFMGSVVATKQIAKDLESGKAPWDMKPMLLGGPNVKTTKDGTRFNTIPFRHRTSGGATKDQHFSGVMPRDILKKVRRLKPGQKLTGTGKAHPPKINPTTGYKHKSGIYEGMKRVEGKGGQGKYITMRRVSDNSPDGAWWHPGYEAHNLVGQVIDYCRPGVEKTIQDAAMMDIVNIEQVSVGLHIKVG